MLADKDRIFTNLYGFQRLAAWKARRRAASGTIPRHPRARRPDWIIDKMKESGLRGRGGAGFPTGLKWSFMPKEVGSGRIICGQCRRVRAGHLQGPRHHAPRSAYAGRRLPGRLLRDAARNACYIYVRGEFIREREALQRGDRRGLCRQADRQEQHPSAGTFDLYVHHGAGAYICGEETALLESLEGKKGQPRLKPPFPASVGLYGCPTTVNNVEIIAVAPTILRRGADWFAGIGRPNNTGTKVFCISGHVNKPCNVEEEMGIPLRELIDKHCGGVRGGWDNLLAVIPGGASVPLLPRPSCDTMLMDFDRLRDGAVGPRHGRGDRHGQVDRRDQGDRAACLFLQA